MMKQFKISFPITFIVSEKKLDLNHVRNKQQNQVRFSTNYKVMGDSQSKSKIGDLQTTYYF